MRRLLAATAIVGGFVLFNSTLASATIEVCTGTPDGNINMNGHTFEEAENQMPCGWTAQYTQNCTIDCEPDFCQFSIGNCVNPDFTVADWRRDDDQNGPPLPSDCHLLMSSITLCGSSGPCFGPEPVLVDCPDPVASDDCDPDDPFCCEPGDPFCESTAPQVPAEWTEECRAYALMPEGWDEWTPAQGFFTVGRPFPLEGMGWRGIDEGGRYGVLSALADGTLGPTVMGIIARTPLWGGEDGVVELDQETLRQRFGLCVFSEGANVASPHWLPTLKRGGHRAMSLLARCDGEALKGGHKLFNGLDSDGNQLTSKTWASSGVMADDILERFLKPAGGTRKQYELVCITAELAHERRAARAAKTQRRPRE